jgi:hypothetical protein
MLFFPCSLNSPLPFLLSFSSFLIFSFLAPPASVSLSFLSSLYSKFPLLHILSFFTFPSICSSYLLSFVSFPPSVSFSYFSSLPLQLRFPPLFSSHSLLLLLLPFLSSFFPFLPLTPLCPSFNSPTELCWSQITSNASPPILCPSLHRFPSLHFYCSTSFIKLSKFPYTFSVSLKGQSWLAISWK